MKPANAVLSSYGTTIFEVMSRLAQEHGAVNLGQGTPEGLEPADVMEAAAAALRDGPHQYPSMWGLPALRQAVAAHNAAYWGLDLDWQAEVMITSGATEALAACLFGLIEPGDEVVLIEPLYDSYLPIIRRAGGVPRVVRLNPPDWALPREDLAAAFSARTKLLLLNTPQNPCAKVFSRDELEVIAGLLQEHDAYAVCDEVYEHLTFDGRPHIPLMTLPGMRERALRIGSFGKVFSLTNWKVGYIAAAPAVMAALAKAHQFLTFTTPIAQQAGFAWGLTHRDDYVRDLPRILAGRRDRLAEGLRRIGFAPLEAAGTYFLSVDFSALEDRQGDADFCRRLTAEAGVAAVPLSAFYQDRPGQPAPPRTVRFCFAKTDAAIDEALRRLEAYFKG